jgi:hypothetical protein
MRDAPDRSIEENNTMLRINLLVIAMLSATSSGCGTAGYYDYGVGYDTPGVTVVGTTYGYGYPYYYGSSYGYPSYGYYARGYYPHGNYHRGYNYNAGYYNRGYHGGHYNHGYNNYSRGHYSHGYHGGTHHAPGGVVVRRH